MTTLPSLDGVWWQAEKSISGWPNFFWHDYVQRSNNEPATEFKAPWNVVVMGAFSVASLYCVGKAFSLKILGDMRGEVVDAGGVMLVAMIVGVVAECLGAAYLYRHKKHGSKKKSAPLFVIALVVMLLLPIQFAVLSIWVIQPGH